MSILFQPVERIMTTEILSAPPDMPVFEAALRMSEKRCSSILVMDAAGRAVGIWTETDALKSELHEASSLPLTLGEAMSSPVLTLQVDTTVHDAVVMFHDKGIRHALVVDQHGHRGVLSMTDIIRHQGGESFLGLRRLESLEIPAPCVLEHDATLQLAIDRMAQVPGEGRGRSSRPPCPPRSRSAYRASVFGTSSWAAGRAARREAGTASSAEWR